MSKELKLIAMSEIEREDVRWLWYPYIPQGKVTIIQGDPGEGKTTLALALAAKLTKGEAPPGVELCREPTNVIYQTAEDGLGDTIRPRLEDLGADCSRVLVIDESEQALTLSDERLEQAIRKTGAGLAVLDPIQAYLGSIDMHRANEVRPVFKRLCLTAERTGCAVVLIGHMNKMQGAKSSYRGLGSIDFQAAARSVLVVGRMRDDPSIRIMAQCKSSLAPEGRSIAFELCPEKGFRWKGYCETTVEELLCGRGSLVSKTTQAENLLKELLSDGDVTSEEITEQAKELEISNRTVKIAKQNLGVKSFRKGDKWYSSLPRG
ncbi:MAG: AAA family ATPase [Christensenellales bacterium]